ncbi:MAG: DNA mismatch repair protein MutS [Bacteroidetes bacterium]|nr:MAG: DNA mismatch repair protein MutS [Bacteroidota bacterium]
MNWIFIILILVILIYLINHHLNKRKSKKIELLTKKWGIQKENEYFNFETIEQYFVNTIKKEQAYHIISDQTNNDLDLNEIFKFIDRTTSKIGQQYLYYKIRTINNQKELYLFDKLVNLFKNNDKLRINCQVELLKLNTDSSYDLEKLINAVAITKPNFYKLLLPLSLFSIISIIVGFFYPIVFLLLIPLFITNAILHYKTKSYIKYYLSAVSQLNRTLKVSKKIISNNKIKEYFTDLTFIRKISEISFKTSFISFEKQLDNEFAALFWLIIELIKIQFNIEGIIFYNFIDDIIKKNESIDKMYSFIGEIDSAISVASVSFENNKICKPKFVDTKEIIIKDMIHPLINDCVPNDIKLQNKSLLLTGSNMSGKTTFIRMVAINSILSQTLNIAFASEFSIPYYKVYSSIRIEDDLLEDTSYYLKEVLTIRDFIEISKAKHPSLFILDEIFKGTNTIERISGGKAILSFLNKENNFVLVSTHDIELTELLVNNGYELYHFSEKIEKDKLLFDHKLKKGKLKTRNAIKILELYGYPKEIISDARKTEKNFG